MGTYVPTRVDDQKEMLETLGAASMEDLFHMIPKEVRLQRELRIAKGMSEFEVRREMETIAAKNKVFPSIFRGAGAYHHYIPAIVKQITSKEEFVTAYTPYQPEISQGVLQSIFEYQTMICELTGMDVSNASVYDGATAAAEAVVMTKERKRKKALISSTVHPQTIEVINTYCRGTDLTIELIPSKDGVTDLQILESMVNEEIACVFIQQPNYYGLVEDGHKIGELAKGKDAKYIISCNPVALAVMKTPREYGADIAIGDGQPLGLGLAFGGPYLGFMATTTKMMRKLPGRIAGETVDTHGNPAFVLTLQAREQHIRRENASSNICSNQALCAMTSAVYLAAMGREGLQQVASLSMSKAHYLAESLCRIEGIGLSYSGEYFHEFVTESNVDSSVILKHLEENNILGGYPLDNNRILWCVTEMNRKDEIDNLVKLVKEVVGL